MNIVVAGGTGFIGQKIVSSLIDNGHKVFVLTRDLQKHKNTFSKKVDIIAVSYTHLTLPTIYSV